ncbi:MAG: helix-turn-helix domain-containing protein [Desulfurococcaceae archaeon]
MGFENVESTNFPVHWISKDARYKIIELMLSTRSITELARILAVSPTAVRKYTKRISHPSDEVLAKAIESSATYERDTIISILINDLVEAIDRLYRLVDERHKQEIKAKLSSIIGSQA